MQGRTLDVGVIGCGRIAQAKHLPYLQKLSGHFRVRGLSDRNPEALKAAQARFPTASAFLSFEDLVAAPLDAVLIATDGTHLDELSAAAAKGCHIFVEKPLCLGVSDAERALQTVNQHRVVAMVGYMKRHDAGVRWAIERFHQEENPRFVQCSRWEPSVARGFPRPIDRLASIRNGATSEELVRVVTEEFGSPLSLELRVAYFLLTGVVIHDINLLRTLLGEPLRVLHANLWHGGLAGSALLQFPGVVASLTWLFLADGPYHERFNLVAERQRIEIDFPSPFLHNIAPRITIDSIGLDGELQSYRADVPHKDPFELQLEAFHAAVCGDAMSIPSFKDAIMDLSVIRNIVKAMDPLGRQ